MHLSIIIPAFDEARKIGRDVAAAANFLRTHQLTGEIIVADDGSRDGTADAAQASAVPCDIPLVVLRQEAHRGKGFAVRSGILASRGDYVMFADSGLTVPFEHALRGVELICGRKCDIAHGSRRLPGSIIHVPQDSDRRIASALFRTSMILIMGISPNLTDTQCGFKVYRGNIARTLYRECVADGFMFDIEVILRAQQHGFQIREFPIEWSCDRDSRLTFRRSTWPLLRELYVVRRALAPGSSGRP